MKIIKMHLLPIKLQLKRPFISNHETVSQREITIIGLKNDAGIWGYGELEAFSAPYYTAETQKTARSIIRDIVSPLLKNTRIIQPEDITSILSVIAGNQMAKAAVETAVWDLFAKTQKQTLAELIAEKMNTTYHQNIPVGISIGAKSSFAELEKSVVSAISQGYQRIKIKVISIEGLNLIKKVIQKFPDLTFMIDANSSFNLSIAPKLAEISAPNLVMIEQPLRTTDFVEHSRLQLECKTRLCLDENIFSLDDVKTAYRLKSARAINLKSSRVGGITNALAIISFCWTHDLLVWCGGMLEAGIGRATNLALASLTGLNFPGDISASSRYYSKDIITSDFILTNGKISLPAKPGIGVSLTPAYQKALKNTISLL
ncbi:o-succinylbenzoate synthase [Liquorilactobacillus hordei]|uniref:o-succinylbenzoate synthase n=1 Tax=Liquorilactobacillus hordei TaxID=468911 RepID=UPI0039EAA5C3